MSSDNREFQQQKLEHNDELSLVEIFCTVKKNSKLFFSIIILCFIISLTITYSMYQSKTKVGSGNSTAIEEYIMVIEIGKIYGDMGYYIDSPNNTVSKIENIYIPKFKQSKIDVKRIKKSGLIRITVKGAPGKIDHNKILLTLANYILEDHNAEKLKISNKNSIKPTKIIQEPTKRVYEIKNKNRYIIIIPVFGIIFGIFLGFIAIFIKNFVREFISKLKDAEKTV